MTRQTLNPDSPVPLYQQLADTLKREIHAGRAASGSRLPSEPQLAQVYGIGRPTVRQATELLQREGLVERRRGAGTFVCSPKPKVDLFSLSGTLESFTRGGVEFESHLCQPLKLRVAPASEGNPFSGRDVFFFARLSSIPSTPRPGHGECGRRPVLLEEVYVDPDVFPNLERFNLQGASLARIVADDYHRVATSAEQRFSVIKLDSAIRSKWLEVKSEMPVLRVQRIIHFQGTPCAIYSELFCLTDELTFSQTIGVPNG